MKPPGKVPGPVNWWSIEPGEPLRFVFKHRPKLVTLEDGRVGYEIHPEDAHLLILAEPVTPPEGDV